MTFEKALGVIEDVFKGDHNEQQTQELSVSEHESPHSEYGLESLLNQR